MSNIVHIILALASGITIETLYALGVIFISERRGIVAALLSVLWGIAFLIGVNETFKTWIAAVLWCIGLGIGTIIGVYLKRRPEQKDLQKGIKMTLLQKPSLEKTAMNDEDLKKLADKLKQTKRQKIINKIKNIILWPYNCIRKIFLGPEVKPNSIRTFQDQLDDDEQAFLDKAKKLDIIVNDALRQQEGKAYSIKEISFSNSLKRKFPEGSRALFGVEDLDNFKKTVDKTIPDVIKVKKVKAKNKKTVKKTKKIKKTKSKHKK